MVRPRSDISGVPMTPRWYHRLVVWSFLGLIIAPVGYRGLTGRPLMRGLPRTVADAQNISCLFSTKPDGWTFFYVQVQPAGSTHCETVEMSSLAAMRPFGYRSRLHRYLVRWQRREGLGTREMAVWALSRYAQIAPEAPPPDGIRIALGWTRSTLDNPPAGRWNPPPWHRLSPRRRRVIAEYRAEELAP